jgi:hypothetical protein
MFMKLAAVMVTMLCVGAYVLTTRQAVLQARSEQTQAYLRIHSADDQLLTLRSNIAMRVMPESVRNMTQAAGVGTLNPAIDELPPALALQGLGTIEQMREEMRAQLLAFRAEQDAKAAKAGKTGSTSASSRTKSGAGQSPSKSTNAKDSKQSENKSSDKKKDNKSKPAPPSRIARNSV